MHYFLAFSVAVPKSCVFIGTLHKYPFSSKYSQSSEGMERSFVRWCLLSSLLWSFSPSLSFLRVDSSLLPTIPPFSSPRVPCSYLRFLPSVRRRVQSLSSRKCSPVKHDCTTQFPTSSPTKVFSRPGDPATIHSHLDWYSATVLNHINFYKDYRFKYTTDSESSVLQ